MPWANKLQCKVERTSTYAAAATVSVGASVKVGIVADMNDSVAATVSNSVTALYGSTVDAAVPANTTVYCDRGSCTYRGTVKKTVYPVNYVSLPSYFTVTAPTLIAWRFRR